MRYSSNSAKKTKTSRKKKKNSSKKYSVEQLLRILFFLFFLVFSISSLISIVILNPFKAKIVLFILNAHCHPPTSDAQIVYDALSYNNLINDDKEQKEKILYLLNDTIIWFSNRYKAKQDIKFSSQYDYFCFSSKPEIIGKQNNYDLDYEIKYNGIYRYKNPKDGKIVKLEGGRVKIKKGKILEIVAVKNFESKQPEVINSVYASFSFYSVVFSLLILLVILVLVFLPANRRDMIIKFLLKLLRIPF